LIGHPFPPSLQFADNLLSLLHRIISLSISSKLFFRTSAVSVHNPAFY